MNFCKEVQREKSICWQRRFEYPFMLNFAERTLPFVNLSRYVQHADEQKQYKLKEPFQKSHLYERFFVKRHCLNKIGIRRG